MVGRPEPPFGADLGHALYVAVAEHNAALCSWICWSLLFDARL
jgi:hypothetical protein